jgi:Flp pilus assembly protein TadG
MMRQSQPGLRGFGRQTTGAATVEFALVLGVLLMLVAGILDFGHAWYMRQVVTNASREGARYGITYKTNSNGVRLAPAALSPSISTYLLNNYQLSTILPSDANPSITLGGGGLGTGTKGAPLEVTVQATKTWFILSSVVPGFDNQVTLSATTVMLCE